MSKHFLDNAAFMFLITMFPFSLLIYAVLLICISLQTKFYSLKLFPLILLYCILCCRVVQPQGNSHSKPLSGMHGEPHLTPGIYKIS